MQKRVLGRVSALLGIAALGTGCPRNELKPVDLCSNSTVNDEITTQVIDKVDLLFMVDNSNSMEEEQKKLAAQLPKLAAALAKGELQRPGREPRLFPPVKSLHVGVVTSDMGVFGKNVGSCDRSQSAKEIGDDGVLQHRAPAGTITVGSSSVDCGARDAAGAFAANHLEFESADAATYSSAQLGEDFACITQVGTAGCGLEQQLEAVLKAVTPSTSDIKFVGGSSGQGDTNNAGFLRKDSILAIVEITDEEDCSAPESSQDLFDITQPYAGDADVFTTDPDPSDGINLQRSNLGFNLNARCARHADDGTLYPVSRYIDGLKALRKGQDDLIVYAAITGIPLVAADGTTPIDELVSGGIQDFDAVLDHPDMQTTLVMSPPAAAWETRGLPKPACTAGDADGDGNSDGRASPARRMVEVAKGFEANGVVRSICADDFSSALNAIVDKIANALDGGCLDRGLVPNEQGLVECDIVEWLPVGETKCDATRGRVLADKNPRRKDENGQEHIVCKINQVAVDKRLPNCSASEMNPEDCLKANPDQGNRVGDGTKGWYYDDFSAEKVQACMSSDSVRIAFTDGAEQAAGAKVQFECLQPVFSALGNPKGKEAVNKPCDGSSNEGKELEAIFSTADDPCAMSSTDAFTLRCQPSSNTCQVMCRQDNNCPRGWECYRVEDQTVGYCVNPTCPPK